MVNRAFDDEEKPLDPAVLRVQARLRRLMLIAGLTLGLGIVAVLGAIVYKLATYGGGAAPVAALPASIIPAGARLVSTTAANNRVVLAYEHPGGTTLIFVDPRSLAIVGRLELTPEGADPPAGQRTVPSSP